MIPTVAVLLKIAKGLGRRPEELIRDQLDGGMPEEERSGISAQANQPHHSTVNPLPGPSSDPAAKDPATKPTVSAWQLDLSSDKEYPTLELHPLQRAIVLVERGELDPQAGDQRIQMDAGDRIEVEGGAPSAR